LGGASSSDIVGLIEFAKDKIKQEYGINLETEVAFLGFE
jgi:UDP-N-acetylenolpyruvoylglucosamine reductase